MDFFKFSVVVLGLFFLSSCGGCGDCMMCEGDGKMYWEVTGEVTCPDCGGDGCSSDKVGGDRRTGAEAWEDKHGK